MRPARRPLQAPYAVAAAAAFGGGSMQFDPFSLSFITSAQDTTNQASFTFSVALGGLVSGANRRFTLIGVGGPNGGVTSLGPLTVGGITASRVIWEGSDVSAPAQIWIANTSGLGATADVVVPWGASVGGCGVGIWRLVNPGTEAATATAIGVNGSGVSTCTLAIPSGGKAIAIAQQLYTVLSTCTWTGTSTPGENYDAETDSGDCQSGAISTATGAGLTFIATMTQTSPTSQHAVAASWGP